MLKTLLQIPSPHVFPNCIAFLQSLLWFGQPLPALQKCNVENACVNRMWQHGLTIIGEQSRRQNRGELLHESLLSPASGRERHAEARLGLLRRDGAQHQELRRRPEVHEEDQRAK